MAEMAKSVQETLKDNDLLIKAYDESITLPREELARRIALATNSHAQKEHTDINTCSSSMNDIVECGQNAISFKVGDYVRATYDADGIDYEGKILVIDGDMCLLKYIGYENKQEVPLSELLPSWGKKARCLQFEKAKQDEAFGKPSTSKRSENVKSKSKRVHVTTMPPPPPMPPMLLAEEDGENSDQLSAMLMSWYMSGYYTGVYQGMKIARSKTSTKKQPK